MFFALAYLSGLVESLLFSYRLLCMALVYVFSLMLIRLSSRNGTHSSEHYQTMSMVTNLNLTKPSRVTAAFHGYALVVL